MSALVALVVAALVLELARVGRGSSLEPDQRRARAAIVVRFRARSRAALRVAWCESRWHPGAIGGGNVGVFQIRYRAHARAGETWRAFVARMIDLETNVGFAFRLSAGGRDWSPWTCRP